METDSQHALTADESAGVAWWNSQPELVREFWLRVANSARAADAWAAYSFVMKDSATDESGVSTRIACAHRAASDSARRAGR